MKRLHGIPAVGWAAPFPPFAQQTATRSLEQGLVLFFPALEFPLSASEKQFLDPAILKRSKNVSYSPASDSLGGTACQGRDAEELKVLLRRFADAAQSLLERLLIYGPALRRERTSLRPAAVEGRVTSWRKDDTRLHVDAFPSAPTNGRRLLRVFCNVNPHGKPRTWRIGEPFLDVAKRFWPKLPPAGWFNRRLLALVRATKGVRSEYDHYMLELHDAMKADAEYQQSAPQQQVDFPSGSAWACFTDQVSHAATAGQQQFEQTFTLDIDAQQDPNASPLRMLERLASRPLVPVVAPMRKAA